MLKFQFFGVEPVLIDKVVFYTERRIGGGKYSYESSELVKKMDSYRNAGDWDPLQQVLRELFWICDQGRRPWSQEAEQVFLSLASVGFELLNELRTVRGISNEIYTFIDPLRLALRLQNEAEHLEELDNDENGGESDGTLAIFNKLIHIYISIFGYWAADHPNAIKLPPIESMRDLLETEDDSEFEVLLSAMAKTRGPQARTLLLEFASDEERTVRFMATKLLSEYF